jgi:hypothetical protein
MPLIATAEKSFKWIQSVFQWLRSFVPGVQLLFGIVALGVGLICGFNYYATQDTLVQTFLSALAQPVEPSKQEYKALEAVIHSALVTNYDYQQADDSKAPKIDGALDNAFSKLCDRLATNQRAFIVSRSDDNNLKAPPQPSPILPYPLVELLKVNSNKRDQRIWHQFLSLDVNRGTDAVTPSGIDLQSFQKVFLFVPGITLRKDSGAAPILQENLNDVLRKDMALRQDIAGALDVADLIPLFDGKTIWHDGRALEVVQSYYITQMGVALLRQVSAGSNQQQHYITQLYGDTFLPDKPYFWKAIKSRYEESSKQRNNPENRKFNHISAPYIDLGINGPIRTYCWGFVGKDTIRTSDSAFCLDVALPNAKEAIKEKLEKTLSAHIEEVNCFPNRCGDGDPDDPLTKYLTSNPQGPEKLFGAIHVFPKEENGRIIFTVPIRKFIGDNAPVKLLKSSIDLEGLQQTRMLLGLISVGSLMVFFTIVMTLFLVYWERKKESMKLLENLDGAMLHISDPYVRVDPDDIIRKANRAFKDFLEREDVDGTDIKEYLEPLSKVRYEDQKVKRERGEHSIYEVTFVGAITRKHKVRIAHGVPLPVPKEFQKRVPDRFGILTPPTN